MAKKRVLVGMSGGVDSSVVAALLHKRGYDVIGITMQLLPKEQEKESACCNLNAISDAKRVCHQLGIPHYTLNIRDEFKHHVIDYFVDTYMAGETPNPCVECNRFIKFDVLKEKAKHLGADYVATGHYCKRTYSPSRRQYFLRQGRDSRKDQSYFLYMLTSEQLAYTLFPLGNYTKDEVRALADDFGLLTAKKSESQDICFVSKGSYQTFIEKHLGDRVPKAGFIVDKDGTILGKHQGIHRYTIGQRKGLGISGPEPYFVIGIDTERQTVIVGKKDDLQTHKLVLGDVSFVNDNDVAIDQQFWIKTRYQMQAIPARLTTLKDRTATLTLGLGQRPLSPGQSGVLYDGDKVIGGGIIRPYIGH